MLVRDVQFSILGKGHYRATGRVEYEASTNSNWLVVNVSQIRAVGSARTEVKAEHSGEQLQKMILAIAEDIAKGEVHDDGGVT